MRTARSYHQLKLTTAAAAKQTNMEVVLLRRHQNSLLLFGVWQLWRFFTFSIILSRRVDCDVCLYLNFAGIISVIFQVHTLHFTTVFTTKNEEHSPKKPTTAAQISTCYMLPTANMEIMNYSLFVFRLSPFVCGVQASFYFYWPFFYFGGCLDSHRRMRCAFKLGKGTSLSGRLEGRLGLSFD